jgi:alpha-glucosidase
MSKPVWWKRGIIYQIYPRSFMDSDGDGIGDLKGIQQRLDYLVRLGVDAIWLSPIFPSPMADFGYDVSDYTAIHPLFGTIEEFDRLLAEAHRRELRVILDFVPNHTSAEHAWFKEARRSRAAARRDWYIWRDPAPDGGPPNNWLSEFGGSAWEWDATTGQYYYHAFLKEQPDLNWRNPAVRSAMYDVLRFWLDRGVDGFRVDVLWHLIKDDEFRDNPLSPGHQSSDAPHRHVLPLYTTDRPEVQEIVAELRCVLDDYDERVLIGELYLPVERLVAYYGKDLTGAHLPFNFQLIEAPWTARGLATLIDAYEGAIPPGGWPNWVVGNHDKHRVASRIGAAQARVAAMLLLTLRGTPTMYYGDELGMSDVPIAPHQVQDPFERNVPGLGLGRDPARTPMQWDGSPGAGFTTGAPWLPLAADFATRNVQALSQDPRSILSLYHRLIALRRERPSLVIGSYQAVPAAGAVLAFQRQHDDDKILVILNMGPDACMVPLPEDFAVPGATRLLLSTHLDREGELLGPQVELRGDEGIIAARGPGGADLGV